MTKNFLRTLAVLLAAGPAIVSAQAPKDAVIVSDADIKAVLKMAADTKRTIPDNTLRVIDMGTYQLGVAVVARGKFPDRRRRRVVRRVPERPGRAASRTTARLKRTS